MYTNDSHVCGFYIINLPMLKFISNHKVNLKDFVAIFRHVQNEETFESSHTRSQLKSKNRMLFLLVSTLTL